MRCRMCGENFVGEGAFCSIHCKKEHERIKKLVAGMQRKRMNVPVIVSPLAKINHDARKAGMSYGQYVAWQQSEKEKRIRLAKKESRNGKSR